MKSVVRLIQFGLALAWLLMGTTPAFAQDACTGCTASPTGIQVNYPPGQSACVRYLAVLHGTPNCPIVGYLWDFGDGIVQTTSTPNVLHGFAGNGTYTVVVSILLSDGTNTCRETLSTTVTIDFCSYNDGCNGCEPILGTIDQVALGGCRYGFNVQPSLPLGCLATALEVDWSFGDGDIGYGNAVTHQFATGGIYNVCVTVTATGGAVGTAPCGVTQCFTLVVPPCDPGCATCELIPGSITVESNTGCDVLISAAGTTSSNTECQVLSYEYDFGDGSNPEYSTDSKYPHIYQSSGTFHVCVTETWTDGTAFCSVTYCEDVTVTGCADCTTDYAETNNSPAQATNGNSGGFQWNNLCISPGDEDWIELRKRRYYLKIRGANANTSGRYTLFFTWWGGANWPADPADECFLIETMPHLGSTTDTYLELYRETPPGSGILGPMIAMDDNSGTGNFSQITWCPNPKTHYVAPNVDAKWSVYPTMSTAGSLVQFTLPEDFTLVNCMILDPAGRSVGTVKLEGAEGKFRLPAGLAPGVYTLRADNPTLAAVRIVVQ